MKLTVQAQNLQIGDKVSGMRGTRTVTHRPSAGVKTPRGKVDLGLDGFRVTWGKTAEITVERAEEAPPIEADQCQSAGYAEFYREGAAMARQGRLYFSADLTFKAFDDERERRRAAFSAGMRAELALIAAEQVAS